MLHRISPDSHATSEGSHRTAGHTNPSLALYAGIWEFNPEMKIFSPTLSVKSYPKERLLFSPSPPLPSYSNYEKYDIRLAVYHKTNRLCCWNITVPDQVCRIYLELHHFYKMVNDRSLTSA